MHFEGEFRVPGTPSEVIRRFEDVPRMASCMPGAVLEPQAEDGSWPGKMIVAFGPKKVAFKGKVTCSFDEEDHTGTLNGRGTADMRAARIGVRVSFALRPDPGSAEPRTIVKVVSDAELGGVLADFARTGGVAVANVIMADFARRASEEFAKDIPAAAPEAAAAEMERASGSAPNLGREGLSSTGPLASAPEPRSGSQPRTISTTVAFDVSDSGTGAAATRGPAAGEASFATRDSAKPTTRPATAGPQPEPAALSAHGLLWAVLKMQFVRLSQWLGLRTRDAGHSG